MESILGIIGEYNPFHNGHLYQLHKSIELVNAKRTVLILSGNYVQRGDCALIDKWKRNLNIKVKHFHEPLEKKSP